MAETKVAYKKPKTKITVFSVVNYIVFIILALIILVPMWKVLVDSFNAVGVYQFRLWPTDFTLDGYKVILGERGLLRPLINSFVTTIAGALLGLVLSTLGGYVLIQFDMPGRNLLAYFLLFTMIFSGGMIPEYLVMRRLGLLNNMWILGLRSLYIFELLVLHFLLLLGFVLSCRTGI